MHQVVPCSTVFEWASLPIYRDICEAGRSEWYQEQENALQVVQAAVWLPSPGLVM